jgi:cytochrome c oxidase subunit 2
MWSGFPLFPERASTLAGRVDALFLFLIVVTFFFAAGIALTLLFFAVKYKRKSELDRPAAIEGSLTLELVWTIIPTLLTVVMFFWGTSIYFSMNRPPDNSMEVYVVAKRWMWKLEHMTGQREINELHVPVGVPVKLIMTSEDVIHSFFVPAFRMKRDVLPGRYSWAWFQATKTGTYHLFCAEYCGTKHSGMIGQVVVLEAADYQAWLAGGSAGTSLAAGGQKLFQELNCVTCHRADVQGRGPLLDGLFGSTVKLQTGEKVVADEGYIRESILSPAAKIVAGYQPIMPTYQGQVSEEQILQLIAYIQSLKPQASGPAPLAESASPQAANGSLKRP